VGVWGVVLVVRVCVSVSGVMFSVGVCGVLFLSCVCVRVGGVVLSVCVCVCDLLISSHTPAPLRSQVHNSLQRVNPTQPMCAML